MWWPLYKESAAQLNNNLSFGLNAKQLFWILSRVSGWPWLSFVMINGTNSLLSHLDSPYLIIMF